MMRTGLLDVNVLIALFDPAHLNHEDAHRWFAVNQSLGWATCTITLNGCIRILSSPSYPSFRATPAQVIAHLRVLCQNPFHRFWNDSTSLLDPSQVRSEMIGGPRNIVDVSLVALASHNDGRLVTFDRSISVGAIPLAKPQNICQIDGTIYNR
jgi:toxin-antitoxin system PIN domain toxin